MKNIHGIAFFVLGIVVFWLGATRVTYNVDVLALLPPALPEVKGVSATFRHFSGVNELLVTVESDDPGLTEAATADLVATLEAHPEQFSAITWRLPLQEDPDFAAEFLAWLWLNSASDDLDQLSAQLEPDAVEQRLEEILDDLGGGLLDADLMMRTYDPLGFTEIPGGLQSTSLVADESNDEGKVDPFTSADGTFRMLYATSSTESFANYTEIVQWLNEVRPLIEAWQAEYIEKNPEAAADAANLRLGYTGKPSFIAEVSTGMEGDMRGSMVFTSIFICILFWIIHRKLVPLVWLFSLLLIIVGITLLIGSSVLGQLSVMSIGFAAILLGLVVDYGVVLYKEAHVAPGDPSSLRRIIGPSVMWAALTTGSVFFALHFSSLPGVAQLGTLVTTGVIVGGIIMLVFYSPVAAHFGADADDEKNSATEASASNHRKGDRVASIVTVVLLLSCVATLLTVGPPDMATDFRPMRLRNSPSTAAYDIAKKKLHGLADKSDPVNITASDPAQLAERVAAAHQHLQEQLDAGKITAFSLPVAVVPSPQRQQQNRAALTKLIDNQPRLLAAIDDAGFSEDAAGLAKGVFANWQKFLDAIEADGKSFALPEHPIGQWVIGRFVSFAAETGVGATTAGLDHEPGQPEVAATGWVTAPEEVRDSHSTLREWAAEQSRPELGIRVSSWSTLTVAIHELIRGDFVRVFLPMALILTVMLVVVFRNLFDALLALATLSFSGMLLIAATQWFGFSWNFFNITAVPILFGTAVDYSIHMIFALRRSDGDLRSVRRGISKAILFCAGSTAVGFGSLSIAANQGLSSLGQICGLGILTNMLAALLLLPHWWRIVHRKKTAAESEA